MSNFSINTDFSLLQFDRIHSFLSEKAYWSLGIPKDVVIKAAKGSICFGVYNEKNIQVGYARVITDKATFGWLCDVYIEPEHRGKGLSKRLMKEVLAHPDLKGLRRIGLATKDAHQLYEQFGFEVSKTPQNFMEIKDNEIYSRG